jgi:FecR protein
MPIWKYSGFGSGFIAFLLGTVMPMPAAQAQTAGTVGAVNKDATGTQPGRSRRPLDLGAEIVQNERIQTDTEGTAHIIFNDRSALNIGRNSNVVIDTFVYDASAGAGSMAVSLAKGAARFVGGQVSHSTGASLRTPAASIGIRGGNVSVEHGGEEGSESTLVIVHNGIATVSNAFGSQRVRTGMQIIVTAGQAPGEPTTINLRRLKQLTRRLASNRNQSGGADQRPSDSDAGRNQIGTPRNTTQSPNFDLPATGDNIIRDFRLNDRQYP